MPGLPGLILGAARIVDPQRPTISRIWPRSGTFYHRVILYFRTILNVKTLDHKNGVRNNQEL